MNLTDLKPGPELDALVAEKVMGWTRSLDGLWHGQSGRTMRIGRFAASVPYVWSPSTNISDAWQVVGQFTKERWRIQLRYLDDGGWHCRITRKLDRWEATAGSAPHAICRAALAAQARAGPANIIGEWPGDETDEEVNQALDDLS